MFLKKIHIFLAEYIFIFEKNLNFFWSKWFLKNVNLEFHIKHIYENNYIKNKKILLKYKIILYIYSFFKELHKKQINSLKNLLLFFLRIQKNLYAIIKYLHQNSNKKNYKRPNEWVLLNAKLPLTINSWNKVYFSSWNQSLLFVFIIEIERFYFARWLSLNPFPSPHPMSF